MHKIMQLISNFMYKTIMFPFMQLHVHLVNLMGHTHAKIGQFVNLVQNVKVNGE
jgi:hypothetical protein